MTARNVYARARESMAARVDPVGMREAYEALLFAEVAHADGPRSPQERNYAYISVRKSEAALARAREEVARQEQVLAERALGAKQYGGALVELRDELERRQLALRETLTATIIAQLELREQQARLEGGGLAVISRTGVFFETGSATLSSAARKQLDIVASELLSQPPRETLIAGYADTEGDSQRNLELSRKRADAVREYLESRGLATEDLRAVGVGDAHPVASNDTPMGRARNRRVEIATAHGNGELQTGAADRDDQLLDGSRQNVRGTDADSADDPEQREPEQRQQPKRPQPKQP